MVRPYSRASQELRFLKRRLDDDAQDRRGASLDHRRIFVGKSSRIRRLSAGAGDSGPLWPAGL